MTKYIDQLKKYGKKTISKTDLEKLFSASSDEKLFGIISALSEQSILSPIQSSQTNGNRVYPIYLKYKISLPKETYEAELAEIGTLHPLLLNNGYLKSKPEEYQKHRAFLQMLDRYLFNRSKNEIAISRKERSFEIFDQEKVLDDPAFCALLERIGITASVLAFYDTPEYCFNDYIPEKKAQMTLLICENKDVWFNIRRMMFENGARNIFGTPIDGVIYGCGNKISGANALSTYTQFVGSAVNYLYWGDIDRAGLNIYWSAVRANPEINIQLFVPAYEEMLRLAQNKRIPDSDDRRGMIDDYSTIYAKIDPCFRSFMKQSIEDNKRIPQEIISYAFLKDNMR